MGWQKKLRQRKKRIRQKKRFWRNHIIQQARLDKEYRQFVELPNT